MMGRRILITGGAGFIGTLLAARLSGAGDTVTILDRHPPRAGLAAHRYIQGDVCDEAAVADAVQGQDVVYNLAAEHHDNVRPIERYDLVNVEGGKNVVRACTKAGVEFVVFTSSVAVYGDSPNEMSETHPHAFINDYGRTKSLAEDVFTAWARESPSRTLVIVRPTAVFGPGNRGNVYNLLKQINDRRFLMVGTGKNKKSIAYVENVAGFLAHVLNASAGIHVYNYADKPDFDMNGLVELVRRELGRPPSVGFRVSEGAATILGRMADLISSVSGRKLPISSIRVQKFLANTVIGAARMRETGYTPLIALNEGMRRTIRSEFGPGAPDQR